METYVLEVHGDDLETDCGAVVGIGAGSPVRWDALAVVLVVVAIGVLVGAEEGHHGRLVSRAGLFVYQYHSHDRIRIQSRRTDSADGISSYKNVAAPYNRRDPGPKKKFPLSARDCW